MRFFSLNNVQSWGSPGLLMGTRQVQRAGVSLKVHHKPASSAETLALLSPVPPTSLLHAYLSLCLSHLLILTPSLPSIPWDIPDLFLDYLIPYTGSSLLNAVPKNCSPAAQRQQQEEHRDALAHQGVPRQENQPDQGMGSTAEGLIPRCTPSPALINLLFPPAFPTSNFVSFFCPEPSSA